jgi:hypothetical protein
MDLIFISSPQGEFARLRHDLCYFILSDPYLSRYFNVFIFENLPASAQSPEHNYLSKIDESTIYLGVFGKTYGRLNASGVSATEQEFDHATDEGKDRLIFIKALTPRAVRAKRMENLIRKAGSVTYDTFRTTEELKRKVLQSLLLWQQNHTRSEGGRR